MARVASDNLVSLDAHGRPFLRLAASAHAPDHRIVIEEVQPVVTGFCATCREHWRGSDAAERKSRACDVMVAYFSVVNRSRPDAERLRSDVWLAMSDVRPADSRPHARRTRTAP